MPECSAERAVGSGGLGDRVADGASFGRVGWRSGGEGHEPGEIERSERLCDTDWMDNAVSHGRREVGNRHNAQHDRQQFASNGRDDQPRPTNGHWRDADWLFCRDGKWRPVEPGTFPLAHGAAARVGRLRGYGNAIVAPAAQAFIEAYLDTETVAANDNHCSVAASRCA